MFNKPEYFINVFRSNSGVLWTSEWPIATYDAARDDAIEENGFIGFNNEKFYYHETAHRTVDGKMQMLDFSLAIESAEENTIRNPYNPLRDEAYVAYQSLTHS